MEPEGRDGGSEDGDFELDEEDISAIGGNTSGVQLSRSMMDIIDNLHAEDTNNTFAVDEKQLMNTINGPFSANVSKMCQKLSVKKDKFLEPFYKYLEKSKSYLCIPFENPVLDLYFTPVRVLIKEAKELYTSYDDPEKLQKRVRLLRNLYDHISSSFPAVTLTYYYESKRCDYERCFLLSPNNQRPYFHYQVKYLRPDDDPEHDSDYLVEKLFGFYTSLIPEFHEISSFILFWAFKRKILSMKYINETAFKVLLLAFLMEGLQNIPNIIHIYRKQYSQQLKEIRKCVSVGPGGILTVDPHIKQYNKKYVIQYRRGFKLQNGNYDVYPVVFTIDYPLQKNEVLKMQKKLQDYVKNRTKMTVGKWIYRFIHLTYIFLQKGKSLRINLAGEQGKSMFSQDVPINSQMLQIIHPVYGHNIAQGLKKPEDLHTVKEEFRRADMMLRGGDIERIQQNLCADYRS